MQEFNKLLNLRVNKERHEMAMKYCKDNNISLTDEIRKVIDKYWRLWTVEENKK